MVLQRFHLGMDSGQDFAGRAECGLGFLRAEGCGLRKKLRAECGLGGCALPRIFFVYFLGRSRYKLLNFKIFLEIFNEFGKIFLQFCAFSSEKDIFFGAGCGLMRAGKNGCGPAGLRARAQPASIPNFISQLRSAPSRKEASSQGSWIHHIAGHRGLNAEQALQNQHFVKKV